MSVYRRVSNYSIHTPMGKKKNTYEKHPAIFRWVGTDSGYLSSSWGFCIKFWYKVGPGYKWGEITPISRVTTPGKLILKAIYLIGVSYNPLYNWFLGTPFTHQAPTTIFVATLFDQRHTTFPVHHIFNVSKLEFVEGLLERSTRELPATMWIIDFYIAVFHQRFFGASMGLAYYPYIYQKKNQTFM